MATTDRDRAEQALCGGAPSAAEYRKGCRCAGCRAGYREYLRAYRSGTVALAESGDGAPVYHVHRGRPSATTARRWGCAHPTCLALAGLVRDDGGAVRDPATGLPAAGFGTPTVIAY